MDAVKFIKTNYRMCLATDCKECRLGLNKNGTRQMCHNFTEQYPEEAVEIVKDWAEKNPKEVD